MNVLVIGDGMVDTYIIGKAERQSAEAPIPIVDVDGVFELPGGARNVAANLEALGAHVLPIVGTGPIKCRVMVGDRQLCRMDFYDACSRADLWQLTDMDAEAADAVVVADYAKGAVDLDELRRIKTDLAPGVKVYVDTKRDPLLYRDLADVFFPNVSEYEKHWKSYQTLLENPFVLVVVKYGSLGMMEIQNGDAVFGHSVEVRCVNGAGDSVMAAYVYADLSKCADPLAFANAAGAIAVSKPYTSTVTVDEVMGLLESSNAE